MLDKRNDPISIEKKIKISLIDYSKLNKIKEYVGKCFVTQKELSAEQAFWLKHSSISETPVTSHTPVRIEAPSELPKCLELETELLKKKYLIEKDVYDKLLKSYSTLEKHCIYLELTTQVNQEIFQKDNFQETQNVPTFNHLFEINELKAQSQESDMVIRKLKDRIKSLGGKDSVENVKKDTDEIQTINIELEHRMFKLDIEPISHRLKDNRDAHEVYLEKTIENTDTSLWTLTKTYEKLVAVTPMNKAKKVMFAEPVTSLSNSPKQIDSFKPKDSNKHLLTSIGVKPTTSASGSKPSGNTKNNRITRLDCDTLHGHSDQLEWGCVYAQWLSDKLEWVLWYAPWLSDQLEWICGMLHGLVINWSSSAIETSRNGVNGFTPRRGMGFRMELVQGATPICEGSCHLTPLRGTSCWNDCKSCKVRVGSNGNSLWEASVLLGRKKGGVRYARKDDRGVSEGREDVREVFQQRGSGAKRKLSRCGRNQMGNEPSKESTSPTREDDRGDTEEEKMVREVFQHRKSVAKRKLIKMWKEQLGNEPIMALPEGADRFFRSNIMTRDSKELESFLEKEIKLMLLRRDN
ncbi:hypothetical protein Tco_0993677 [Tanacetum coccineum]